MNQRERLHFLIEALLAEDGGHGWVRIPPGLATQYDFYRSLVNMRPPIPVSVEYLAIEDAFLQERVRQCGVVDVCELPATADPRIALWQGDITRLAADAIVNAANAQLLGCFQPRHGCIDNAIHTAAGVRLRLACAELMRAQGTPEPPGRAKITPGYNLPAAHVLHTVGPQVTYGRPTARDEAALAACYFSCLDLACTHDLHSVAFCCISTGVFGYPPGDAARVAVRTVADWLDAHPDYPMKVVFNVFLDSDLRLYEGLLG